MGYITKQDTFISDPPATYRDYSGGINTSLSNETLQDNELRDGLNCHYNNDTLVNRKGVSLLTQLSLPINERPQGDFLYTTEHKTYIISVRDGHIFYGEYAPNSKVIIQMQLLLVDIVRTSNIDDSDNYLIGLETLTEIPKGYFEGFIYKFSSSEEGVGDDDEGEGLEETEYLETLIIQNRRKVQGISYEDYFILATGTRLLKIQEKEDNGVFYLHATILEAFKPNAWEINKIGVNNLSPFPNYHLVEYVENAPITQVGSILTNPKEIALDMSNYTFEGVITAAMGTTKEDYYYKWEAKVNTGDWSTLLHWKASKNSGGQTSKNQSSITVDKTVLDNIKGSELQVGDSISVRLSITTEFDRSYDYTNNEYKFNEDLTGDYIANKIVGHDSKTHITKKVIATYNPTAEYADREFYRQHSCTKVVSHGDKLIFYDDMYNSGEWFKTVVNNPNYISYGGNLNFKTSKNERIVGVVVFDTNIVVFSDNNQLGGNISVVTGNGDDFEQDDYYSPYKREIVNTSISCDVYNTIQIADNYIIFKYRNDIFMLDTTSLTRSDTLKVFTINDMVKQRLNNIEMPLNRIRLPYDNEELDEDFHEVSRALLPDEVFSEVVDGYYGLIFPFQATHLDSITVPKETEMEYRGTNELLKQKRIENIWLKPGLRWKCYFRSVKAYQNKSKEVYPWLRDASHFLDIVSVLYIEGRPCYVRRNGDLITFNRDDGTNYDGSQYRLKIRTKGYDMELPSLSKFLDNLNVYYNRDFNNILYMTVRVYNESGYILYGPQNEAYITTNFGKEDQVRYGERITFDNAMTIKDLKKNLSKYDNSPYIEDIDRPVIMLNEYGGIKSPDGSGAWETPVLDRPSYSSKTFTPRWRFPYLSASVEIDLPINQGFSLSSLTFSYTSSDMPEFTREKLYTEIISGNALE